MIELLAMAVGLTAMVLVPMMGMIWLIERFDP